MGVSLLIFSNHKIRAKSFDERLHQIEILLETKVQNINLRPWKDANIPEKTSSIKDIVFFTDTKNYKDLYCNSTYKEILIYSNYKFLSGLRIFEKTMSISLSGCSTKWSNWLNYLGGEFESENKSTQFIAYNKNWKIFQKYQFNLIHKLGGDKVVYFGDHSFEEPEDLFYQGKDLKEVIIKMEEVGNLFDIKTLYTDIESIVDNDEYRIYGFYEKIKTIKH